jgi:hypothetical protein
MIPNRASDAGPVLPAGYVECHNCGTYAPEHRSGDGQPEGPRCQGAVPDMCLTRLCANCEQSSLCEWCHLPVCIDHSRPSSLTLKKRVCANCDAECAAWNEQK